MQKLATSTVSISSAELLGNVHGVNLPHDCNREILVEHDLESPWCRGCGTNKSYKLSFPHELGPFKMAHS